MRKVHKPEAELVQHLVDAGNVRTIAESIGRHLQVMAAIHFKTCLANLNPGLNTAEEMALKALERDITEKATAMAGVSGVEFRHDPRGGTVGLLLESKESNSFVGRGWWIEVARSDIENINIEKDFGDAYLPATAEYVSVWDDGVEVVTKCLVDLKTGEFSAEVSEEDPDELDLEILEREMIRLSDGSEFTVVERDDGALEVEDLAGLLSAMRADNSPSPQV
jgi:hypothetical protein